MYLISWKYYPFRIVWFIKNRSELFNL